MENQAGLSQPTGKKLFKGVALSIRPALTLALLFVLCASLSHSSFVHAQADTPAGHNLVGDSNVGLSAIAPTLAPAVRLLSETGEAPLTIETAPWWVIVVVLTVLVIGFGTRTKTDR